MKRDGEQYLGDGVYASFDGYHIWLEARMGNVSQPHDRIALEPEVFAALCVYARKLIDAAEPKAGS